MLRRLLDSPWPYFIGAGLLLIAAIASQFEVRLPSRPEGRPADIVVGGVEPAIADIVADRAGKDGGLLLDDADVASDRGRVCIDQVHPADADVSALRVVEPVHERGERGFEIIQLLEVLTFDYYAPGVLEVAQLEHIRLVARNLLGYELA